VGTEHPALFIAREKPPTVRVTLPESTLVLSLPSVRGDSILGISRAAGPARMVAVPTSGVRRLETHGAPTSTKVALGTIGVVAVGLAIAAMFLSTPALTNP